MSKFFFGSILCYHIGVVICYIGYKLFNVRGAWICLVPLAFSLVLVKNENRLLRRLLKNPFKHKENKNEYNVLEEKVS